MTSTTKDDSLIGCMYAMHSNLVKCRHLRYTSICQSSHEFDGGTLACHFCYYGVCILPHPREAALLLTSKAVEAAAFVGAAIRQMEKRYAVRRSVQEMLCFAQFHTQHSGCASTRTTIYGLSMKFVSSYAIICRGWVHHTEPTKNVPLVDHALHLAPHG